MPLRFPGQKPVEELDNSEGRFDRLGQLRAGYTQQSPVQDLVEFFSLEPDVNEGMYNGTQKPVAYNLNHRTVKVTVLRLDAKRPDYLILTLVMTTINQKGKYLIFQGDLTCMLEPTFPCSKPRFRADKKAGSVGDIYQPLTGNMCLFNGSDDWKPEKDTIISGINVAFEQIVLAFKR